MEDARRHLLSQGVNLSLLSGCVLLGKWPTEVGLPWFTYVIHGWPKPMSSQIYLQYALQGKCEKQTNLYIAKTNVSVLLLGSTPTFCWGHRKYFELCHINSWLLMVFPVSRYLLINQHFANWKITMSNRYTSINQQLLWPCSLVLLNHLRVHLCHISYITTSVSKMGHP